MERIEWVERIHLLFLIAVVALSGLSGWFSPRDIAVGGGVMALNFLAIRLMGGWVFRRGRGKRWSTTRLMAGCFVKVVMLVAAVAALLSGLDWNYHAPSLILGISMLLVTILASLFVRRFDVHGTSV